MDQLSIEYYQKEQAELISQSIHTQSGQQLQKIQQVQQSQWLVAHMHLVSIQRIINQDYCEACEKSNHPLEKLADDELAYLIHIRMRALMDDVNRKEKPGELAEIRSQLEELSRKYSELEQMNMGLVEANKKLQDENSNLNSHLSALRQAQRDVLNQTVTETRLVAEAPVTPGNSASLPTWIKYWQASKGFEKSSVAILVMGDTGKALRPSITREMAKRLSLSMDNNSLGELLFIEVERDVHKDKINLYEASNGNIFVFSDNLTGQRAIQGEINLALGGLNYNSFLTNLHGLRNGKRSEKDGGIWLSVRRGK
jgi:hypothetical protein